MTPDIGYSVVYHLEIGLLFLTLATLGPLVRSRPPSIEPQPRGIGLAEFPT
jgi:BCD family chlorophyll transporter-like MFS transporter